MNSSRHIDPEDLSLFALQFLTSEQNRQVREHLSPCSLCREEVAQIRGDLAVVASTADLHSPPALARDRLLQQVAREPRQRSTSAPRPLESRDRLAQPSRSSETSRSRQDLTPISASGVLPATINRSTKPHLVARILPWAGWAVAAGLAVMVARNAQERESLRSEVGSVNHQIALVTAQSNDARRLLDTLNDPSAQRVTLTLSKQTPVPQGKVTYVAAKGALVFVANNLEPLEPAKVYELWIIPAGGSAPIAVGTFHPDATGNASLITPKLPQGVAAKAFGITIESDGGSQTPTMPIIMAGAAGA